MRCDISSKEAMLSGRNDAEMGPPTRYMLRHNTASIIKDLILQRELLLPVFKQQTFDPELWWNDKFYCLQKNQFRADDVNTSLINFWC